MTSPCIFSRRAPAATAQALPTPGTVPNSAGRHAFAVDGWARLDGAGFHAAAPP